MALLWMLGLPGCGFVAVPDQVEDVGASTPTPAATPTPTPRPSTLDWQPCGEPFECATMAVPLDHADPDGEQIELALIRLPAPAAANRIGTLVVNPGGPGGSGVEFVRAGAVEVIPAELRARFDVVGFDPRGVGGSTPSVACGELPEALSSTPDASEPAGVQALTAAAVTFAASCAERSGELLAHVSTTDVARDLDLLREALGDERLTYVGYSYGTLIGAAYAELHGDRSRALVLDGAVDPALDLAAQVEADALDREQALNAFFRRCEDAGECASGDDRVTSESFAALLERLRAAPLPAQRLGPDRQLGEADALTAVHGLILDRRDGWPLLAQALLEAQAGDGSLLLGLSEGQTDGQFLGQFLAVTCTDHVSPAPEAIPDLGARLATDYPHFGAALLRVPAVCAHWPAPPVEPLAAMRASEAPQLLVIGTTGDGVTPYEWSVALAEQLDRAVLFTRQGERHTAFGGDNVCTDRVVIAYLLDLTLPEPGSTCG